MTRRHRIAAGLLVAACHASLAWAQGVQDVQAPPPGAASCPGDAAALPVKALYGSWEARIDGQDGIAAVLLEKHPEYEGVRGSIQRAGGQPPAQLAGDIDPDGLLALDESQDGKSISASWSGTLQPGSCGKQFKGTWRRASDDSSHAFVLHKASAWK